MFPTTPWRQSRRTALVLGATTALLLTSTPSAHAATTDVVGATAATALTLTLNLPGGAATKVVLSLDPVTGTVSRTTTTTATADATVLLGSLGEQSMGSGTSSAKLPEPLESSSNPAGAIQEGLAGTPLENLLKVELLPSSAKVSATPTSESQAAVANVGAGLPDALADGLSPLLDPLTAGVDQLLTTLSEQAEMPVAEMCAGLTEAVAALEPVTVPLDEALGALPIPVPAQALLDETALGAVCGLATTLDELNTALQDSLASLTGDSGVLGIEGVTAEQNITTTEDTVTSVAEASIAELTLLGQTPFANAQVLQTKSTAKAGPTAGSADATIDSTIANLQGGSVDPFLQLRTTIEGIRDSFVGEGELPVELETVFDDLFATLNAALAPIGITVFKLDDSPTATALEACPAELSGDLSGTFAATDGSCAAAATRGVGIQLNLPAELATALTIAGPLVELQIVPSMAMAQVQPRQEPTPTTAAAQLPRTGGESGILGLVGLALIVTAVVVRRRRVTVAD